MKRTILVVLAAIIGIAAYAYSQIWTPSNSDISQIEKEIKLDQLVGWKSAHLPALAGYTRYYASSSSAGKRVILGELVDEISEAQPGVHVVATERNFPVIMDGGCSIINLVYSVDEHKILSIRCNGYA